MKAEEKIVHVTRPPFRPVSDFKAAPQIASRYTSNHRQSSRVYSYILRSTSGGIPISITFCRFLGSPTPPVAGLRVREATR